VSGSQPPIDFLSGFLFPLRATRAFTSFLMSAIGSGFSKGNWIVPLDVMKSLSSFLNSSITDAVGNKLQRSEKRGEPDQHLLIFERGNTITDGLDSLRWNNGTNGCANLFQVGAGGTPTKYSSTFFGAALALTAELRLLDLTFFIRTMLRELAFQVHASDRLAAGLLFFRD